MTFDSDRSTKTDFLSNGDPRLCCVRLTTIKHLQNHKYYNHLIFRSSRAVASSLSVCLLSKAVLPKAWTVLSPALI